MMGLEKMGCSDSWRMGGGAVQLTSTNAEEGNRLTPSKYFRVIVAFPEGMIASVGVLMVLGNATVIIRYFDGVNRFPASAFVDIRCIAPPPFIPEQIHPLFANPTIVIYTASWATLIAVIIAIFWLHRRKRDNQEQG